MRIDPLKVMIVDDHPLMRQATKELLLAMDGIEDVIGVGTGTEALETVDNFKPDIVFLDFHLPDQFGDEVAKQLKIKFPKLHIIIFTGIDVTELYNHFLDLQVSGIVSKESDVETIRDVIRGIRNNHAIVPLELFHKMRVLSKHQSPERALTEEEHDIMTMVVGGFTNEYIAEKIHMSKRSVDNYLKKIYDKFGVKSRAQAIERYVQSKHVNKR